MRTTIQTAYLSFFCIAMQSNEPNEQLKDITQSLDDLENWSLESASMDVKVAFRKSLIATWARVRTWKLSNHLVGNGAGGPSTSEVENDHDWNSAVDWETFDPEGDDAILLRALQDFRLKLKQQYSDAKTQWQKVHLHVMEKDPVDIDIPLQYTIKELTEQLAPMYCANTNGFRLVYEGACMNLAHTLVQYSKALDKPIKIWLVIQTLWS